MVNLQYSLSANVKSIIRDTIVRIVRSASYKPCESTDSASAMFEIIERGSKYTADYRVYLSSSGKPVSTWHDIPMFHDVKSKIYNMVVEIPRWTNAKIEINKEETLNPIKQDIKKGRLRFVHNTFPHHGYIWNYGAIPQTWENPESFDELTGCKGDNDPLDVCEIGQRVACTGDVLTVKLLGALAMLDEGETDWKILAIDTKDPMADQLNDVADVELHMPGLLHATLEWFRLYKMPEGKPANTFALGGEFQRAAVAWEVVEKMHHEWSQLMAGKVANPGLSLSSCSSESLHHLSADEATTIIEKTPPHGSPAPIDTSVNKWHYLQLL